MNLIPTLLLSSFVGLFAGISHGVVSHELNLPMSLPDQIAQSLTS